MKEWESNKEENNEFDESMDDELIGIKRYLTIMTY